MFFTIPNLFTWARIAAIPLLVGVFFMPLEPAEQNILATVLFILFAVTDWVDGYLARKLNQSSEFGAFLDPVADKFLVVASLLLLLDLDRVHVWIALIIVGREVAVSALREWMAQIGAAANVAVHMVGKLKTTAQMTAIPFLLLHDHEVLGFNSYSVGTILITFAAGLTIVSMAYYLQKAIPIIKKHSMKK
jgi:CDP-diacylglycerol--glycerol-3-phosphate 3-phosphatidyltransferase